MPNELKYQSLVVRAINQHGGFAFKLSNKFLAGVPDLFICLPKLGSSIWEVKSNTIRRKVNVTPLQDKFLNDLDKAGGTCGVISFIEDRPNLFMGAYLYPVVSYEDASLDKFVVSPSSHTFLRRGEREATIVKIMEKAYGRPK